jgi:hypothetical protein
MRKAGCDWPNAKRNVGASPSGRRTQKSREIQYARDLPHEPLPLVLNTGSGSHHPTSPVALDVIIADEAMTDPTGCAGVF